MKIQLPLGLLVLGLLGVGTLYAQTTATPTISLGSGPYAWPQYTILTDGTAGASIKWCNVTSGTCTPSTTYANTHIYLNPSSNTETICANAMATGYSQSARTCNYYTTQGSGSAPGGDSRTVSEPAFPSGCDVVTATKYSVWTNAVNIDPYNATAGLANGGTGTQGTLGATGGSDFEPSSSSSSYTSAETSDYSAINNALSGGSSCVELKQGSSGQSGFVMTPFTIPADKTLIVNAGVTVYMSRNPSDYNNPNHTQHPCGTLISGTGGIDGEYCLPAITMDNGSALMGYGRIDFRGWGQFTSKSTCVATGSSSGSLCGFYYNTIAAFLNTHSQTTSNSYGMPAGSSYNSGYGVFSNPPEAINIPSSADNVVIYKITLLNTPGFGIQWAGSGQSCVTSGLTLWGVKIIDPFDTDNTDGFDPISGVCNFTVRNVYISNGDDNSAIKAATGTPATTNGTFINIHKYSGLGMAIGSATGGEINNIWYSNLFCSGPTVNGAGTTLSTTRDTCIKAKSPDNGTDANTVSNVNYIGVYIQYEGNGIWVYPYYSCPGTPPTYTTFTFKDVTLGSMPPSMSFQGWDSNHHSTMFFNNFTATGSFNGPNSPPASCNATWSGDAYGDFTIGPNPVTSTLQQQLAAGTGSIVSGSACTSGCVDPYSATPLPLVGELVMSTSSSTNQQCSPSSPCHLSGSSYQITLQATLQAGAEYDIKELPLLSASGCPACTITFWDSYNGAGPTQVGTARLGTNGITATLPVTITGTGPHFFSATYSGDSYYAPYAWGAVAVDLND